MVTQNYETGVDNKTTRKDGYLASASYTLGDFTFKLATSVMHTKKLKTTAVKTNKFYVSPGFEYQVIPASKVYGNYLYERSKSEQNSVDTAKTIKHGFLLGV